MPFGARRRPRPVTLEQSAELKKDVFETTVKTEVKTGQIDLLLESNAATLHSASAFSYISLASGVAFLLKEVAEHSYRPDH